MIRMDNKLKVMNMCDYCTKDSFSCQANRIFSKSVSEHADKLETTEAVVACDKYLNPVAVTVVDTDGSARNSDALPFSNSIPLAESYE